MPRLQVQQAGYRQAPIPRSLATRFLAPKPFVALRQDNLASVGFSRLPVCHPFQRVESRTKPLRFQPALAGLLTMSSDNGERKD